MKKFFTRFDNTPDQQNLVGKTLVVGNHAVEVVDIIAEGMYNVYQATLYLHYLKGL